MNSYNHANDNSDEEMQEAVVAKKISDDGLSRAGLLQEDRSHSIDD